MENASDFFKIQFYPCYWQILKIIKYSNDTQFRRNFQMNENEKIIEQAGKVASEVGTEIVKQGYQDIGPTLVKPTATTLGLLPRAIRASLSGLEKWVLQKEYSVAEVAKLLEIKLQQVGAENIVPPEAHIAVPALQYISYCMDNEELRDMYANLLASSMNKVVKNDVHPSYVEIIKQLCPDEAKVLRHLAQQEGIPLIRIRYKRPNSSDGFDIVKHFSNVGYLVQAEFPKNLPQYLDNLTRLGLINIDSIHSLTFKEFYKPLRECDDFKQMLQIPENYQSVGYSQIQQIDHFGVISSFGKEFCRVCITDGVPLIRKAIQKS